MSTNNILPHSQAFEQAFIDPQTRQEQIQFSQARVEEFTALAENATSPHWRDFWCEAAQLHRAAIRRLEILDELMTRVITEALL